MPRMFALLCFVVALTGCASSHPPLAQASGAFRPLNADRWQPTADDLNGVPPTQPPAATRKLEADQ